MLYPPSTSNERGGEGRRGRGRGWVVPARRKVAPNPPYHPPPPLPNPPYHPPTPSSSSAAMSQAVTTPTEGTKVFYYMTGDRSETPYVTTVARKSVNYTHISLPHPLSLSFPRMSEVRLKDFKAVFDRQGAYRFYFKTKDPDCGVVREEVCVCGRSSPPLIPPVSRPQVLDEEQLLPCWNGKIIVWVSEKGHHHHR